MSIDSDVNKTSERRLVENELIFAGANDGLKHTTDRVFTASERDALPLEFYCECSDMACREKIQLTVSTYDQIRKASPYTCFLLPGHEITEIEKVVDRTPEYVIVEKINRELVQELRAQTGHK